MRGSDDMMGDVWGFVKGSYYITTVGLKIWLSLDKASSFHGNLIRSQNQSVGII